MNIIKSVSLTLEEAQYLEDNKISPTKVVKEFVKNKQQLVNS